MTPAERRDMMKYVMAGALIALVSFTLGWLAGDSTPRCARDTETTRVCIEVSPEGEPFVSYDK